MLQHREMVKAGTERARQNGEYIGRPSVMHRPGFSQQLEEVLERIRRALSRRRAAKNLDIRYATLKRLLDARGETRPSHTNM